MNSYTVIGYGIIWSIVILFGLSWIYISSKGKWYLKVLSTLFVFSLIFSTIYIWREVQGTPKKQTELDKLIIKSYLIKEPSDNDKGTIWLWIIDPKREILEPINLAIPYSKQMHKELVENQGLRKNRPQQFKKESPANQNESPQYKLHDFITRNMTK